MPITAKYCLQYVLLITGFALLAYGMINWSRIGFSMQGIWFFDNDFSVHALHLVIIGIAMIPPAMWEIFLLETRRTEAEDRG